jgi:DNA topoisomerase-1
VRWLKEAEAKELEQVIKSQQLLVANIVEKKGIARPKPPFITSTLQQAAGRKLRLSSRRTMDAAQRLFQNGHITYMRTDSVTLSAEALTQTRSIIQAEYGKALLSNDVRRYSTSTSGAQEAHEAIRPAGGFRSPQSLQSSLSRDDFEVYNLIWQRTLASQMINQEYIDTRVSLNATHSATELKLTASGRVITEPGFTSVYTETTTKSTEDQELESETSILPALKEGELLKVTALTVQLHQTTPPRRWTEASIIEKLESEGIGRPSTYTSILEAITKRGACIRRNNTLIPTFTGFAVVNMLEKHFPTLVDLAFSASIEKELDAIATGTATKSEWLRALYFGNVEGDESTKIQEGFRSTFETAIEEVAGRELATIAIGTSDDGNDIGVRVSKNYGPYLFQSNGEDEITVSIPDDTIPDEVTIEWATKRINEKLAGDRQVGLDATSGKAIVVKAGRFGPYFEIVASDLELEDSTFKPRRAGLWPHMDINTVSEQDAQLALSFPKELGFHPDNGSSVLAIAQGPYGPYVKCDTESRSIEAEDKFQAVRELTLDAALKLLAKPKTRGRNQQNPSSKKELGSRPDTQDKQVVLHLTGRFGPYVTDGEFNASVPKDRDPGNITLDDAVDLLVIREAKIVANGGVTRKPKGKTKARSSKKNTKVSANTNITNILSDIPTTDQRSG